MDPDPRIHNTQLWIRIRNTGSNPGNAKHAVLVLIKNLFIDYVGPFDKNV
jgi:hypothetical protein